MKRIFMIGCGCFGILTLAVSVIAMWFFMSVVKPLMDAPVAIAAAYQSVNEDFPFTPPEQARLDADRFDAYLQVRSAVGHKIQGAIVRLEELEHPTDESDSPSLRQLIQMFQTGLSAFQELPQAHLEALRACEMSLDEYRWHTAIMVETIIQSAESGNPQAEAIRKALEEGLENQKNVNVDSRSAEKMRQTLDALDLPYHQENLDLLLQHSDTLTSPATVSIIDLFTLGATDQSPPGSAFQGGPRERRRP